MLEVGGILCFVAWAIDTSGDMSNFYLGIVLLITVLLTCLFGF